MPQQGEQLSIGLLDAIAIHWLLSVDRKLLAIVKTEFATDLKSKRLCHMIKPISQSIDELLQRYDNKDQVVMVKSPPSSAQPHITTIGDNNELATLVQRVERLEFRSNKQQNRRRPNISYQRQAQDRCKHCMFLNKELGANLRVDHHSNLCGKKNVSVSLVECLHDEPPTSLDNMDGSDYDQGNPSPIAIETDLILQTPSLISNDCFSDF